MGVGFHKKLRAHTQAQKKIEVHKNRRSIEHQET